MPKRECPFGDHLSPQLKIHVGQKQVSNGINKEKEMSKVYERTLSMLKNGSKNLEWKSSLSRSESKTNQSLERNSKRYNHKLSSTMKQMIFNSDLKLRATKEAIDLSEEASCINCQTTAMLAYLRCFYCNDFKCRDCAKECSKCEEYFCEKCSLIVYEDGEHTECLACYR